MNRLTVLYSHGNVQKNIYDAVHNHCEPRSIVMLLNYNQQVKNKDILSYVQSSFNQDAHCFAYATSIQYQNQRIKPSVKMLNFKRRQHMNESMDFLLFQNIEQSIRFFRSELFRLIGHWYFKDQKGKFLPTSLSFLLPILQLASERVAQTLPQKYQMQIPRNIIIDQNLTIFSKNRIKNKTSQKYLRYLSQFSTWLSLDYAISKAYRQDVNLDQKFNQSIASIIGKFSPLHARNRIPKILHQIWLHKYIPKFKVHLMNHNKNVDNSFSYRLWTQKDITKENFPSTFQILQKLIQLNKMYRYSRLASIADLMRYEIIYRYGGFYIDTNYMLFTSLSEFIDYDFFIISSQPSLDHIAINNGIFGAIKYHYFLQRLLNQPKLKNINVYGSSNYVTGPDYFVQMLKREDQVKPQVKILPFERGYPFYLWLQDSKIQKNLCTYKLGQQIPSQIKNQHPIDIVTKGYQIVQNCKKLYPLAIGIDFFQFGGSWMSPRKFKQFY